MTQQPPSISKEERERALDRARWHANCPIDSCKTESGVEKFIPERCEVSRALLAEAAKVEGLEVENKKLNEKAAILLTCRIKTEDDALAKIADLEKERDAYKKAKSENDDRFQIRCLELEQKLKRWEDEEVDKAVCCAENEEKAARLEKQLEAVLRLNDTQLAEINRLRAEVDNLKNKIDRCDDIGESQVKHLQSFRTALAESQGREADFRALLQGCADSDQLQFSTFMKPRIIHALANTSGSDGINNTSEPPCVCPGCVAFLSSTSTPDVEGLVSALEFYSHPVNTWNQHSFDSSCPACAEAPKGSRARAALEKFRSGK